MGKQYFGDSFLIIKTCLQISRERIYAFPTR
jgi:hypothetical protein